VSGNRSLSFGELDELQARLAGWLTTQSFTRGDRVAVITANSIELLLVTVGCLRAGIVPVPISPVLTQTERAHQVEDSGARLLFADEGRDSGSVELVVPMAGLVDELRRHEPAALSDVTLTRPMHYTSGTTGRPKGVWVEPTDESRAMARSGLFRAEWGMTEADVHLVCSPLTHSGPHRFALRTLEAGGTVVIQERFDAAATLAAIEHHRVSSTFMVPTHLERIFTLESSELHRHDLSSIRLLAHAGAPIRRITKERALELFPLDSVWEFYGSTEGGFTRLSPRESIERPDSVGRPRDGASIEIRDSSSGELVGANEIGVVWLRDPSAERFEYWRDEDATAAVWDGDAFTVGDLGHLDGDGYLYLVGRPGELIISGGINVYPREVEEALMSHPEVAEALVYGVDDPEWGQQVRALVLSVPGGALEPESLRTWARSHLAPHKCPRTITLVDELPRTATGKVKRVPPDA
jgi:acyl-CoA synthetase (AMP-forming)/AMP-acid ligase II